MDEKKAADSAAQRIEAALQKLASARVKILSMRDTFHDACGAAEEVLQEYEKLIRKIRCSVQEVGKW